MSGCPSIDFCLQLCKLSLLLSQHEKYSSQLQLNKMKPPGGETSKSEVKPSEAAAAVCEATTAKPTEASKAEDKTAGEPENPKTQCTGHRLQYCTSIEELSNINILYMKSAIRWFLLRKCQ